MPAIATDTRTEPKTRMLSPVNRSEDANPREGIGKGAQRKASSFQAAALLR